MVRGRRILAGAALIAGLGGCHLLFGHTAPTGADGQSGDEPRPQLDGLSGERRAGDLETGETRSADGAIVRDGGTTGESILPLDMKLPSCDPSQEWCKEPADTQKTLRGVWATPDAKTAYAVGDDVVLLRQGGGSWAVAPISPALPAATWRGVHMVAASADAWLVGNLLTGEPVAYHLQYAWPTLNISTASVAAQTLNAIWMTSVTEGYVAAAAAAGGGVIDTVQGMGLSAAIVAAISTGKPVTSVSWSGSDAWAVTAGLEIQFKKSTGGWKPHANLTGFPSSSTFAGFTGVMALGTPSGHACGCGNTTTAGLVFCCQAEGSCTVVLDSSATFHAIAAHPTATGARLWLVGEDQNQLGLIATATMTFGQPINLQRQTSSSPLRGVWASPTSPRDIFAVGDDGTVLHHQDP